MGLKYQMFVTNIPAEQLFNQLVKLGGIDETELMHKDMKFDKKQLEDLMNIHKLKMSMDEKYNVFMDIINKKPDDKELAKYQERERGKDVTHISIWFMSLPSNKNFTFGSFTYYTFFIEKFHVLVASLFHHANVPEWIFLGYHHSSNDGQIALIKPTQNDFDVTDFIIKESEKEKFEKYATRVENKIKYPIMDIHNYISDSSDDPLPWEYQVSFPLTKKEKKKEKKEHVNNRKSST